MTTVADDRRGSAASRAGSGNSPASPARAGVVAEIAERRRRDVERELGKRGYSGLADDAAEASAKPGGAPRPIAERLAAPGLHLIAEVKRRSPARASSTTTLRPASRGTRSTRQH